MQPQYQELNVLTIDAIMTTGLVVISSEMSMSSVVFQRAAATAFSDWSPEEIQASGVRGRTVQ